MKFGSVCSGIEAASVAWHPLGWKAAWLAEIEPFPSAVLAHHYPDVPNLGDMTKLADMVANDNIEAPDVLVGGTPCQAFSVAGARKGLEDERGFLTIKYVELANAIDQKRAANDDEPAIIVWENVPGVLSSKDNAFGAFLGLLSGEDNELEPPGGKWANAGYVHGPQRTIAWRVLDAQYFGVAQRRRRVFVVASARGNFDPANVLFEREGVRRATAPTFKGRSGLPFPIDGGTLYRFKRTDSYVADNVSSTVTARDYKDARDLVVTRDGMVRGLSAEEYEILQGLPVRYTSIPGATNGKRLMALGNSMAVPCMAWIGRRINAQMLRHANDNAASSSEAVA